MIQKISFPVLRGTISFFQFRRNTKTSPQDRTGRRSYKGEKNKERSQESSQNCIRILKACLFPKDKKQGIPHASVKSFYTREIVGINDFPLP